MGKDGSGERIKLGAFFHPTGNQVAVWLHPDAQIDAGSISDITAVAGCNRRLEEEARHGRHPHYYDQRIGPRRTTRARPNLLRHRSL
jgi:hypothetical protein